MQVTCPNCRARYAVDPLAIGPSGRIVQCARCHDRWFQTVKIEPTPPRAPLPPEPTLGLPSPPAAAALSKPGEPPQPKPGDLASAISAREAALADGDASRRPVSPFAPEAMADNFPRFAGPRPSPPPSAQAPSAKTDRSFIDTMPIPDVVIRPSVKGAGLPALIEPKTSRRMSIVLATSLLLVVAAAAAVYVFRAEILAALPAEWRTMLRLSP
jgi:predicted Zn finger-like uncharacterized protein